MKKENIEQLRYDQMHEDAAGNPVYAGECFSMIFGSNILYGLFTNWGFFRHRWITIKWLLTVLMVAMGIFAMGPCVNENVTATNLAVYQHNVETTLMWGWIPTVLQIVIIILSVWKPKLNMAGA